MEKENKKNCIITIQVDGQKIYRIAFNKNVSSVNVDSIKEDNKELFMLIFETKV